MSLAVVEGAEEGVEDRAGFREGREEALLFGSAIHSDPRRVPTPMLTTPSLTARLT